MLNVKELRAEMARHGYTQETLAIAIGMSPRTFYNRLKTGDFGSNEIVKLTKVLKLKKPWNIFFANEVT